METILGVIVGFLAFGVIWFFLLRQKNIQIPTEELKLKEEELKRSEIDLATRVAEVKAAEDAKKDLDIHLEMFGKLENKLGSKIYNQKLQYLKIFVTFD